MKAPATKYFIAAAGFLFVGVLNYITEPNQEDTLWLCIVTATFSLVIGLTLKKGYEILERFKPKSQIIEGRLVDESEPSRSSKEIEQQ